MVHFADEVTVKRGDLEAVLRALPGLRRRAAQERLEVALNGGHALRCQDAGHWWDAPTANEATCLRESCRVRRSFSHDDGKFTYYVNYPEKASAS
jgi:hypothetical protein